MSVALLARPRGVLRYSSWDGVLVALSGAYAALLLWRPSSLLVAAGLWWTANTVAHNFIHTPYFRSRPLNRAFALYLSVLMGVPQGLWRERHLRHHRGDARPTRWTTEIAVEAGVIAGMWLALLTVMPWFFVTVYVPGYVAGLALCHLQGHFEHAHGTTSHYGWLYNLLFFNDGYHVEHHRRPGEHWTRLPRTADPKGPRSRWPAVLRWLDEINLQRLERLALRSATLQRYLIATHERAFRRVLTQMPEARRVTIVGGGLFPRTALILRRLLPEAALSIVDAERDHLDIARTFVGDGIELRQQFFEAGADEDADLVVVPLSFIGDRQALYDHPPARALVVHDWLWNARGGGVRVSWLLLKRLNLVTR